MFPVFSGMAKASSPVELANRFESLQSSPQRPTMVTDLTHSPVVIDLTTPKKEDDGHGWTEVVSRRRRVPRPLQDELDAARVHV
jgi:hypothetical protein